MAAFAFIGKLAVLAAIVIGGAFLGAACHAGLIPPLKTFGYYTAGAAEMTALFWMFPLLRPWGGQ